MRRSSGSRAARGGGRALTFFEYNALAALLVFDAARLDAWVLEVGMGGRLDAVNIVDADVAVVVRSASTTRNGWARRWKQIARGESRNISPRAAPRCSAAATMPAGSRGARRSASVRRSKRLGVRVRLYACDAERLGLSRPALDICRVCRRRRCPARCNSQRGRRARRAGGTRRRACEFRRRRWRAGLTSVRCRGAFR